MGGIILFISTRFYDFRERVHPDPGVKLMIPFSKLEAYISNSIYKWCNRIIFLLHRDSGNPKHTLPLSIL